VSGVQAQRLPHLWFRCSMDKCGVRASGGFRVYTSSASRVAPGSMTVDSAGTFCGFWWVSGPYSHISDERVWHATAHLRA